MPPTAEFESSAEALQVKMPWGKHEGKTLNEVPVDYIDWLAGRDLSNWRGLKDAVAIIVKQSWFQKAIAEHMEGGSQ